MTSQWSIKDWTAGQAFLLGWAEHYPFWPNEDWSPQGVHLFICIYLFNCLFVYSQGCEAEGSVTMQGWLLGWLKRLIWANRIVFMAAGGACRSVPPWRATVTNRETAEMHFDRNYHTLGFTAVLQCSLSWGLSESCGNSELVMAPSCQRKKTKMD